MRTRIARSARMDASTAALLGRARSRRAEFDKLLDATSAEAAALQILRAVARNQRRVLVGRDACRADKLVRQPGSWCWPPVVAAARHAARQI